MGRLGVKVLRLKYELGMEMELVRSLMLEESMSPMTTVCMVTGGKCKSESCGAVPLWWSSTVSCVT